MRPALLLLLALALAACGPQPATLSDPAEPRPTQAPATPVPPTVSPPTAPPQTPLPSGSLIVFVEEGGVAFNRTTVTVNLDGTAHLERTALAGPVDWRVPSSQLSPLKDLLNQPEFANLPYTPISDVRCDDCYVMRVEARTPAGQKSLKFSQGDLEIGANTSPLFSQLLNVMTAVIRSVPQPTATALPAATQPPSHGAGALPPDVLLIYNREGGFAYSNLTLTIKLNGEASLASDNAAGPRPVTLTETDLAALDELLADPGLAQLPIDKIGACNDCYVYTLIARTPKGVVTLKADDADLSTGQWGPFQKVLAQLSIYLSLK